MSRASAPVGRWLGAGVLLATLVSCSAPVSTASPSAATGSPDESSGAEAGNLPAGCEAIELHGPDGESIRLDGIWVAETDAGDLPKYWSIRTLGNCLWGTGVVLSAEGPHVLLGTEHVQTFRGAIGNDFSVDGEIVLVGTPRGEVSPIPIYSPLRLEIGLDADGTVVLREDRVYGEHSPRCFDPGTFCLPVLVLRPAVETAE